MSKLMEWRAHLCGGMAVMLAVLGLVVAPMEARGETEVLLPPLLPGVPPPPLQPPPPEDCGGTDPNGNNMCSGYCPLILLDPSCKFKRDFIIAMFYVEDDDGRVFMAFPNRVLWEHCGC